MAKGFGIARAGIETRVKAALAAGKSAGAWIREMQAAGMGYRRQTMLADWRTGNEIDKKEGLMQFVRKDYIPSPSLVADVNWKLSREFMYKVRVQTRISPGKPLEERFVNIGSDRPLTPREAEQVVTESWGVWYAERKDQLVAAIPETAYRRVS